MQSGVSNKCCSSSLGCKEVRPWRGVSGVYKRGPTWKLVLSLLVGLLMLPRNGIYTFLRVLEKFHTKGQPRTKLCKYADATTSSCWRSVHQRLIQQQIDFKVVVVAYTGVFILSPGRDVQTSSQWPGPPTSSFSNLRLSPHSKDKNWSDIH